MCPPSYWGAGQGLPSSPAHQDPPAHSCSLWRTLRQENLAAPGRVPSLSPSPLPALAQPPALWGTRKPSEANPTLEFFTPKHHLLLSLWQSSWKALVQISGLGSAQGGGTLVAPYFAPHQYGCALVHHHPLKAVFSPQNEAGAEAAGSTLGRSWQCQPRSPTPWGRSRDLTGGCRQPASGCKTGGDTPVGL